MESISSFINPSLLADHDQWVMVTGSCILRRTEQDGHNILVKSLKEEHLSSGYHRRMMKKEYEAGKNVSATSEYIAKYHNFVDSGAECSISMEFIEGESLYSFLQQSPAYFSSKSNFRKFLLQLLNAVKDIHAKGILHLDLKPSNIIICRGTHDVRIIDFSSCYIEGYSDTIGMTKEYAAPEMVDTSIDFDVRTDIYSIGKILQEVTNGNHYGRKVKKIINKCLEEDKQDRWQSTDEIINYFLNRTTLRWVCSFAILIALVALLVYRYVQPTLSGDQHVLYGNYSLSDMTCEAVGKITDDAIADSIWAGNLYVGTLVKHFGLTYTVNAVADHAYEDDSTFYTISLPYNIRRIGERAFEDCVNLKSIKMPNSVVEIEEAAFVRCFNLKSILLSHNIKVIPTLCFHKTPIEEITIPEGVQIIQLDAFAVCTKLKKVHLPETLHTIERGIFYMCSALEEIEIPASVQEIGEYVFYHCDSLRTIYNYATTPQDVVDLFDKENKGKIVLYVPAESVSLYQKARCWKDLDIRPIPEE